MQKDRTLHDIQQTVDESWQNIDDENDRQIDMANIKSFSFNRYKV